MSLFLILCLIISLPGCTHSQLQNQVCFQKHCFDVEVVTKEPEILRGLQFRKTLDLDKGMLFIFKENKRYSFWMKDTYIPLDMIWMDFAKQVVYIEYNAPPCSSDPCPTYTPTQDALYVLEINAGHAQKKGIHIGDQADFRLLDFTKQPR